MDLGTVDKEVKMLLEEIERLGVKGADGKTSVKFVTLIDDDRCSNLFEAIVSTLRAAKRKKVVEYEGEMLLKGVSDKMDIIVL